MCLFLGRFGLVLEPVCLRHSLDNGIAMVVQMVD
jgi:hypothetical protein